ncbi:uncharacterized protein LOC144107937 isoform X1 [Amblyomma americanum]
MDHFVQHAARDVYVCSIFWNVAQAIRFFVKKASKREPWSPNDVARIYVPMVILVLFIGGCFIFWCIWQCRKFRSKEQQKPHTTSLPLGKARVPGPMTSHATTDMHRNVNPLNSREVAPYPPQPARVPFICSRTRSPHSISMDPWTQRGSMEMKGPMLKKQRVLSAMASIQFCLSQDRTPVVFYWTL